MNKIRLIFQRDIKKIATNSMAIILAAGVLILPSLYAWVNIYANWDPYGRQSTGNMQIAVMIEDKGFSFRGIGINVGDEIEKNLRANDVIDWQFLSHDEGVDGVLSGKYYAAIEIPEDFSESLVSIVTDRFEPPQITYYANEKKNAIATKITDKVVQTVQGEVNESFIKTVADVVSKTLGAVTPELTDGDGSAAQALVSDLQLVKTGVEGLQSALEGLRSVSALVRSVEQAVPPEDLQKLFTDVESSLDNTQSALTVTRTAVDGMTGSIDKVLSLSAKELSGAAEGLSGIDNLLSAASSAHLKNASGVVTEQSEQLTALLTSLETVQNALPAEVNGLSAMLADLRGARDDLNDAGGAITTALSGGGALHSALEIGNKLSAVAGTLDTVSKDYNANVKPVLSSAVDSYIAVLADLSAVCAAIGGNEEIKTLARTVGESVEEGADAVSSLSALLSGLVTKLDRFSTMLSGVNDSESVNILYNLMIGNGSELGTFLASPVTVDTDTLYGIDNYGSAMAPFYTTLAIWVGGIILIAIFRTDVNKKKELGGVSPTQEYFGRALTFAAFALIQGMIVCLGDLLFLKIQCAHPLLFLLAGLLASLIYSFFIYSLVAAFGDIGKAIVVILLVIQLGGSGGTFPIDVTPAFFRAVNPYLPFTFVINAMRECVCDTWGADYWLDLLKLCAYIPAALALGLPVRAAFRKPVRFFSKKLEETGLL
ncbi:MAG: YhgE/Pip domain-containing protein [Clostridia bacterium]|nr:YhgE/Pip domain-containing protein [Clostridia bacterium]